jgi:hypothetical protein
MKINKKEILMSESQEMLESQKEMLRTDSFCFHTNLKKDGLFHDVLKNGIEEEFYKELLDLYNKGFDFEIIFNDEISKGEDVKSFVNFKDVAIKLSEQTKNNAPEIYIGACEEAFMEGLEATVKDSEELKKILISKTTEKKKGLRHQM